MGTKRLKSLVDVAVIALIACGDGGDAPGGGGSPSASGSGAVPLGSAGSGMPPLAGTIGSAGGSGAAPVGSGGTGMPPGAGMMPSAGTGTMPSAGAGGSLPTGAGSGGSGDMMPGTDPGSQYHDPGTGPWEMGTAADCKMETSRITGSDNLAVVRYGKLCHIQGGNTTGPNWSATKTLGGVLAGRAAYLVKDVPRTGPGTGPILHEDKATDWIGSVSFNNEALLSDVMSMTAFNSNLAWGSKSYSYATLGTREISAIVDVAMAAVEQLGGMVPTSETMFMQQQVFDKLGMSESSW